MSVSFKVMYKAMVSVKNDPARLLTRAVDLLSVLKISDKGFSKLALVAPVMATNKFQRVLDGKLDVEPDMIPQTFAFMNSATESLEDYRYVLGDIQNLQKENTGFPSLIAVLLEMEIVAEGLIEKCGKVQDELTTYLKLHDDELSRKIRQARSDEIKGNDLFMITSDCLLDLSDTVTIQNVVYKF